MQGDPAVLFQHPVSIVVTTVEKFAAGSVAELTSHVAVWPPGLVGRSVLASLSAVG